MHSLNILNKAQINKVQNVSQKCALRSPNSIILRKTIEGYLDLFPSLTFNTIKTKLIMHAFYSSRYLQPK